MGIGEAQHDAARFQHAVQVRDHLGAGEIDFRYRAEKEHDEAHVLAGVAVLAQERLDALPDVLDVEVQQRRLAADDEDMASYIGQLEQARDTVDSPEASGDAIAQEFEQYLRRRERKDGKDGGTAGGEGPWRPPQPPQQ